MEIIHSTIKSPNKTQLVRINSRPISTLTKLSEKLVICVFNFELEGQVTLRIKHN
ncbi:hypothetical protein ACB092_11G034400 [Castanea dentata]